MKMGDVLNANSIGPRLHLSELDSHINIKPKHEVKSFSIRFDIENYFSRMRGALTFKKDAKNFYALLTVPKELVTRFELSIVLPSALL